jgi:hypothetical protein
VQELEALLWMRGSGELGAGQPPKSLIAPAPRLFGSSHKRRDLA